MPRKPCFLTKSQIGFGDLALRVAHLPVVDHAAQLFRRAVEEGLLLGRQHDRRDRAQLVPVGRAGEQLGVEADGAGFQRLRLGVGDLGQRAFDELEGGRDQRRAADRRDGEQPRRRWRTATAGSRTAPSSRARCPICQMSAATASAAGPRPQRRLVHAERDHARQQQHAEQELDHASSASARPCQGARKLGRQPSCAHVSLALSSTWACDRSQWGKRTDSTRRGRRSTSSLAISGCCVNR